MQARSTRHWKAWLTGILFVGIIGLIVLTSQGRDFVNKLGGFLAEIIPSLNIPTGTNFPFQLTINKEKLNGFSLNLVNGSVQVSGVFVDNIEIGNILREKVLKEGSLSTNNFKGKVDFTNSGTVKLSGEVNSIIIDGELTRAISGTLTIETEITPTEYFVRPITLNSIKLPSVYGEVKRTSDGAIQPLINETLEISNFIGNFQLVNNSAIVQGSTNQIIGKTFTWRS
jgi:hypothetical protein